jgi:hypothetical protein
MNEEIDKWDECGDFFRRKLQDLEVETSPDDWDAIVNRLPQRRIVVLSRRLTYWVAAVIAVLFIVGGSLYLSLNTDPDTMITKQVVPDVRQEVLLAPPIIMPVMPETTNSQSFLAVANKQTVRQSIADIPVMPKTESTEIIHDVAIAEEDTVETGGDLQEEIPAVESIIQPVATIPPTNTKNRTDATRKWGFGMGMGGLTQNSGKVVNTYVLRGSNNLEDEELLAINAVSDQNLGKQPKTNIKHKTPISFGLSISRTLNNRFSLQTGLVYSLLVSDWETQATAYNSKTRQTLHFAGVPLYLSYKIAEWNRFQIYASTGMQVQLNVAGGLTVRRFSDELPISKSHINQRMKELQWSASAHAGVSYPLIPYISAFAEIGAAYYFNNGSEMKTIYSDKAFNINPQIGLRLNF